MATRTRRPRKRILKNNPLRGWKDDQPGTHERTVMMHECGPKCFLGKNGTFPICIKKTCKVSTKGLYAAYVRAQQFHHRKIAKSAKKQLKAMGALRS